MGHFLNVVPGPFSSVSYMQGLRDNLQRCLGMEVEVIHGQIIAKANHYQAVPGKFGKKRIIKDEVIRAYERSFIEQCKVYRNRRIATRFRLFVRVFHSSAKFDLDNSLKTLLDCLQMVGAITDDKLCFQIEAEKKLDKYRPRIEFAILEVNEQKQLFNN